MNRLSIFALVALPLAACQKPAETAEPTGAATTEGAPVTVAGYTAFGEAPADTAAAITAADAFGRVEALAGQTITVKGTVSKVCQASGCWAVLDAGDGQTIRMAVPKDSTGAYKWTLPTNITGRTLVTTGTVERTTLSAEHAEHMDEDGGEASDKPAEARPEIRFNANGALVRNA